MNSPKKIVIVDDHPLILKGIRELLEYYYPQTQIVECETGKDFIRTVLNEEPDLIIADIVLPDVSGTYAVCKIKQKLPAVKVIFLSGFKDVDIEHKCFNSGGDVLISKEKTSTELISQIENLYNSGMFVGGKPLENIKNLQCYTTTKLLGFEFEVFDAKLTNKQKKLFTLIGEGKERKEVIKICGISGNTYDQHCQNIKYKLELSSTHEIMILALNYYNYQQQTKRI